MCSLARIRELDESDLRNLGEHPRMEVHHLDDGDDDEEVTGGAIEQLLSRRSKIDTTE